MDPNQPQHFGNVVYNPPFQPMDHQQQQQHMYMDPSQQQPYYPQQPYVMQPTFSVPPQPQQNEYAQQVQGSFIHHQQQFGEDQLFEEEQIPSAVVFSEVPHDEVPHYAPTAEVSVLQEKVKKFDIALLVLSVLFLLGTLIHIGNSMFGGTNVPTTQMNHGPASPEPKPHRTWYSMVFTVALFCGMVATGILGIVSAVLNKPEHQKKRYATAIANLVGLCVLVSVDAAQLIFVAAVLGIVSFGVLGIVALVIGGCFLVTCYGPCIGVAGYRVHLLRKLTSADPSSV